MRTKGKPNPEIYELKKEVLALIENQVKLGNIDLFYGDETPFYQKRYVPYGWQFDDEQVAIEVCRGRSINCFELLSRTNQFFYKMSEKNINSNFVI